MLKNDLEVYKRRIEEIILMNSEKKKNQHKRLKMLQNEAIYRENKLENLNNLADRNLERLGKLVQGVSIAYEVAKCSDSYSLGALGNF